MNNRIKTFCCLIILIASAACETGSKSEASSPEMNAWKPGDVEHSYWIDIDLRNNNGRGYWKNVADLPADSLPTAEEIANACTALSKTYHGNKLYVTYHRQFEISDAKKVFQWWKKSGEENGLTIVPSVVLESYAKDGKLNFTDAEITDLARWSLKELQPDEFGIYDVYIRQAPGSKQDMQLAVLNKQVGNKLIRIGLQPGEVLNKNMAGGVEDTWTAECQGLTNALWENPRTVNGSNKFGKVLLEEWVMERINGEDRRIVWDMIPVAWDYDKPVDSLGYVCPGDDALINDPPIKGRIELCDQYISKWYHDHNAQNKFFGYSCDLHILHANSYGKPERPSFYEQLKANLPYTGYFAKGMEEIAQVYSKYR